MFFFAFWPSNTDPNPYYPGWSVITHVANLDWNVSSTGVVTNKNTNTIAHNTLIFNAARANGAIPLISMTANTAVMDSVLAYYASDFVDSVIAKMVETGAEGVNFDFEYVQTINAITSTSNVTPFENLMSDIYTAVKNLNSSYTVSICTAPTVDEDMDAYSNPGLNDYLDFVVAMAYDYNFPETYTRANCPFYDDSTRAGLRRTVEQQSELYGANKLFVALPFYGYEYTASSNQAGANIISEFDWVYLRDIPARVEQYGRQWDTDSHTPWYRYQVGSVWHQVWYDDAESLSLKYQYLESQNVLGAGCWALGYEGADSDVWNVFVASELTADNFKLYQSVNISDTTPGSNGGGISTNEIPASGDKTIFDDVSYSERSSGDTEYRKVFFKNENNSAVSIKCWLSAIPQLSGTGVTIAKAIGNDTQTDSSVYTYYSPNSISHSDVLDFGSISANSSVGLWIKRSIPSGSTGITGDGFSLYFSTY